ncbi:hypothetical protein M885DRAFT_520303 [Pelagophyceae sp. CCMP2097]|nr:hypothetical protein M885DRAFT_520303 [Pelagophyceae sp. CCMP2097]|mmetsp:Transcript_11427/g.40424  ORF Transcript_11427/g.40424 Transcript_11427/m.40424 type:complete len:449 (-) Transcript_11427:258-1604(-)
MRLLLCAAAATALVAPRRVPGAREVGRRDVVNGAAREGSVLRAAEAPPAPAEASSDAALALDAARLAFVTSECPEILRALVGRASAVGEAVSKKNRFSGGAATIAALKLVGYDDSELHCDVTVRSRAGAEAQERAVVQWVAVTSSAQETGASLESRLLLAAAWLGDEFALEAALLLGMPGGLGLPKLPDDLKLNNVPASASTTHFFEDAAAAAVVHALGSHAVSGANNTYILELRPPTLNDEYDTYRAGAVLELVRHVALQLVRGGVRVRVCVQGPLGEGFRAGMPMSLAGMRRLLELTDWGADQQQLFDDGFIRFGEVGSESVDDLDDCWIIMMPQSVQSYSILPKLTAHVVAADGRPVILLNPRLGDVQSAEAVMGVRGRASRLGFAARFEEAAHFSLIVPPGRTSPPFVRFESATPGSTGAPRVASGFARPPRKSRRCGVALSPR